LTEDVNERDRLGLLPRSVSNIGGYNFGRAREAGDELVKDGGGDLRGEKV
jgi:hypothetical protein